ncbi:MaoC family dehydratase N-terminal domain-containing protein [Pseudonocardia sp. KRD-291]|nr:MaoC family dehydratase N-terminal domain-containing protein [Pseudonocardia sp. KRD291]
MDPSVVGTVHPTAEVEVERGRLRAFAHAIGETDPVYSELDAARAAGHPDLPVPPTFLFGIGSDMAWLGALGVDLTAVLHGSQRFTYHCMAHAGDTLAFAPRIVDTYEKKGGALQFLVRETAVTRADGSAVADLQETIVVREARS